MGSRARNALIAAAAVFAGLQLVPVERSNPASQGPIAAPVQVVRILERSCGDCHSNRTVWPWYAYVAPVSWLVAHDTNEGREHLNFSNWQTLTPQKQAKKLEAIWEEVDEGEMPLGIYVALHPEAKLSPEDLAILREWTKSSLAQAGVTAPAAAPGDGHEGHEH